MKKLLLIAILLSAITSAFAYDRTGPNTSVGNIYADVNGGIFVYFDNNAMPDCYQNKGAYLPGTNKDGQNNVFSMLLSAKAAKQTVQVFYNINKGGTGWSMCTIHAIYLKS